MKLFVIDKYTRHKIYLNIVASSKDELALKLGSYYFYVNGVQYNVNEIYAENNSNGTASGAVIGGILGLLGGPLGVAIGGTLGGLIGVASDEEEKNKIRIFNNSRV